MSVRSGFNLTPIGYPVIRREVKKEDAVLISRYEADQMLRDYGDNVSETLRGLREEQFVACMSEKMAGLDEDDEIRHTFMAFDMHCRGFLTLDDVKKVFASHAPHVPVPTIHSAFREVDQDGDGRVSFRDFQFLMKYSLDDHI
ncbi:EF-hand calcium-binding domain-containing protein 11-like isoform X2 [Mya arenaria]|uniref:EF-hand calcium-binding domain-containing protein 11-like isoform X2 n=1 Tax=Mya arenaria TaxID=6604 RepID=UPI0022E2148F|nr:EF-hand calcium-binding domain-containing protein 11-like isoform X2 [Mya arenaria]